jgi:hypothetical protein
MSPHQGRHGTDAKTDEDHGIGFDDFLRPDMALIACTTIAWAAAVVSQQRGRDGLPRRGANAVFWLFVGLAALAKGSFALLLIIVPPVTSLAWFGSLHYARGAGWWWAFPSPARSFRYGSCQL